MNIGTDTLEALRRGDQHALTLLYDQYGPILYGVALRITESEDKAAQVVQETFRKIWKNANTFDPSNSTFFSWALTFAKSLANEHRQANEQPKEKFDFGTYQSSHPVGGHQVDYSKLSKHLDEKHLKVIELAYFNGHSEHEIEEAMKIPIGTVNTRLRFALRELRKAMEAHFSPKA